MREFEACGEPGAGGPLERQRGGRQEEPEGLRDPLGTKQAGAGGIWGMRRR